MVHHMNEVGHSSKMSPVFKLFLNSITLTFEGECPKLYSRLAVMNLTRREEIYRQAVPYVVERTPCTVKSVSKNS
jgi:hypothetical protein